MIATGTPIGSYRLVLSCDPALRLPEDPAARATALRVARETGDYAAITAPGERPTVFEMRSLPYAVSQRWSDLRRSSGGGLGPNELLILLFQVALVAVENFGPVRVERKQDPRLGDKRATDEILDHLRDAARAMGQDPDALIGELAGMVYEHEATTVPKS